MRLFRKRPRLTISAAYKDDRANNGGCLYELTPETYAGPWNLKPGTVIEIVKEGTK
jgi:hypothetical protein